MELPKFKYHPDPIATGAIKRSDSTCTSCGQARGFVYCASVYGPSELRNSLCPWCIADGTAAEKHRAQFSDDNPLLEAGVTPEIADEVTKRTPGFNSWQQEVWLACCQDACEFHGDAPKQELVALDRARLLNTLNEWGWKENDWPQFVQNYLPGGGISVFKFRCSHCGQIKYALDFA